MRVPSCTLVQCREERTAAIFGARKAESGRDILDAITSRGPHMVFFHAGKAYENTYYTVVDPSIVADPVG